MKTRRLLYSKENTPQLWVTVLGILVLAMGMAFNAHAQQTYTVTESTDDGSGTANTLSWAITQSNASTGVSDNIAFNLTGGGDVVTISAALSAITDGVTINGTDATTGNPVTVQVTIPGDGGSDFRVFKIDASGETITIENMTIKGGDISVNGIEAAGWGGGIYIAAGNVKLDNVTVSGSKATVGGGIYNSGILEINGSKITGNIVAVSVENPLGLPGLIGGGGISNQGALVINGSTITENVVTIFGNGPPDNLIGGGGGIYNSGTLEINGSTITENIFNADIAKGKFYGGGIYNSSYSTLDITDSKISNNRLNAQESSTGLDVVGGGIGNKGISASLTVENSTISGNILDGKGGSPVNGGGIGCDGGYMTISNSTVFGNQITTSGSQTLAGGGISIINIGFGEDAATINNCTISSNILTGTGTKEGAGVHSIIEELCVRNSIIAENADDTGGYDFHDSSVLDYGYNVVKYQSQVCFDSGTSILFNYDYNYNPKDAWNQNAIILDNQNLNLSSTLADNGGTTLTLALETGSFAIDAIPYTDSGSGIWNGSPTSGGNYYDQRGTETAADSPISIGAYSEPTATQASNVSFASTSATSTTVSWTRGDGANCVVFMAAASSGTASPVDATTYSPSTTFGSGDQIGTSGWYCVYNGTGTSVSVGGLSPTTTYRVHVYEYNGSAGSELYFSDAGTDNPDNVTTSTPSITFTNGANASLNFEQTPASNPLPNVNWLCGQFSLIGDETGATLNSVTVTLGGTYDSGDLSSNPFQIYASNTNDFGGGGVTPLGSSVADPGSGSSVTFSGLSDAIPASTRYYWVTADISENAEYDDTMNGTINNSGNLSITSGTLSGSSSYGKLNAGTDASLPVDLSSFSARNEGPAVILEWVTESETENLGFILERAQNSVPLQWEQIASYQTNNDLKGQGNTSSKTEYTFTDNEVEPGVTYEYRLSDVSMDGNITVYASLSIAVNALPQVTEMDKAYPNPFNPNTFISYHLAEDSQVEISVFDMLGRKVQTLFTGQQYAGSYHVYWNGKSDKGNIAPTGTYIIRMQTENTAQVQKVLLMK